MECWFCTRSPAVCVYLVPPLTAAAPSGGLSLQHDGANVSVCADCNACVTQEDLEGLTGRFVAAYHGAWRGALASGVDPETLVQLARGLLAQFLRYRSDAVAHYP